jgi:hypothetical protein
VEVLPVCSLFEDSTVGDHSLGLRLDQLGEVGLIIHARSRLARPPGTTFSATALSTEASPPATATTSTTALSSWTTTASSATTPSAAATRVVSKGDADVRHNLLAVAMTLLLKQKQ